MRVFYMLMLTMLLVTGADAGPAAEQVIRQQTDLLLERIAIEQSAAPDSDELEQLVVEVVAPHVDFTLFSRLVLGKHWRKLTDAQRQRFEKGLTHLVVKTYATALAGSSGLEISYLNVQKDRKPKRVVVPTLVKSRGEPPVRIDYKLREKSSVWKVYDVMIEGVSMVINYRSVMAERIRTEGMKAVIESLSDQPGMLAANDG